MDGELIVLVVPYKSKASVDDLVGRLKEHPERGWIYATLLNIHNQKVSFLFFTFN